MTPLLRVVDRAILHMISRHFDLDRHRGALLTSDSVFQIELSGYTVKDLQEFSGQIMRMLGEFLFHELRTVRRLERVIEIKRSLENSSIRDFDYPWGRLQEFLTEEREDVNARSIELSLKSPKKSCRACESRASNTTRCCCCSWNSGPAESCCKESWSKVSTERKIKGDRKALDTG